MVNNGHLLMSKVIPGKVTSPVTGSVVFHLPDIDILKAASFGESEMLSVSTYRHFLTAASVSSAHPAKSTSFNSRSASLLSDASEVRSRKNMESLGRFLTSIELSELASFRLTEVNSRFCVRSVAPSAVTLSKANTDKFGKISIPASDSRSASGYSCPSGPGTVCEPSILIEATASASSREISPSPLSS